MAGHMGDDRVTVKKVRIVRDRRGAQPAARQGLAARRAQRAHPREEGLTMPQTTLYDRTGASIGSVELSDDAVRRPGQRGRPAPGRDRPARRPAPRHARHEDPRRGPRRRPQAVPPEGHRPRPPGPSDGAALRAAAASSSGRTRASYDQRLPRKMKRLALRGALTAKFGDGAIKVVDGFGLEAIQHPGARRRTSARGRRDRPGPRRGPGARREARAVVAQPARRSRSSSPTRSTSSTCSTRTRS